jgi:hypothetical protein
MLPALLSVSPFIALFVSPALMTVLFTCKASTSMPRFFGSLWRLVGSNSAHTSIKFVQKSHGHSADSGLASAFLHVLVNEAEIGQK